MLYCLALFWKTPRFVSPEWVRASAIAVCAPRSAAWMGGAGFEKGDQSRDLGAVESQQHPQHPRAPDHKQELSRSSPESGFLQPSCTGLREGFVVLFVLWIFYFFLTQTIGAKHKRE